MRKIIPISLILLFVLLTAGLSWMFYFRNIINRQPTLTAIDIGAPGFAITFNREFAGNFVRVDKINAILTLQSADKHEYSFSIPRDMIVNNDVDVMYLRAGQPVKVEWDDTRTIREIRYAYTSDPSIPLNKNSKITKIEGVNEEK